MDKTGGFYSETDNKEWSHVDILWPKAVYSFIQLLASDFPAYINFRKKDNFSQLVHIV